jgi:hypothetical protein
MVQAMRFRFVPPIPVGPAALIAAPYSLALVVPGVPAVLWMRQRDIGRRSVVVFYQVEDAPAKKYEQFTTSSGFASRVQRVVAGRSSRRPAQSVPAEGQRGSERAHPPDSGLARSLSGPPVLVTNIAVPSIHGKGRSVYFLPDRLIVRHGNQYADLPYAAVGAQMQPQRFIESDPPPTDAQRVGTTWQFANKSGGPDRRFKNNRQLPIMLYGRLTLTSPQGLLMVWDFSRPEVAESLAGALNRMR